MAEDAENCSNSAVGGTWVRRGGGGVSLQLILRTWPQAVRQMRGVGGGGEEGWRGIDNSSKQPLFLFLLVFLSALCPAGFDEKILLSAVQYTHL